MPLASMRSNNLGGSAAGPAASLWLDGLDVLKEPGTGTNRYGVPLDTLTIEEQGPGGVSSMSFVIEDPSSSVTLRQGASVAYFNHTDNRFDFRGFVQHWQPTVFGTGRQYAVDAVGVEAVLDWMVVPSLTLPAGTDLVAALQAAVSAATGIGVPLRTAGGAAVDGTQAAPIGNLVTFSSLSETVTITGASLREAIRAILAVSPVAVALARPFGYTYGVCTIDFTYGVRVWRAAFEPSDYVDLTINDAPAGPILAAGLSAEFDSLIPHAAYVQGGNAAGSGLVPDGSGIIGPVALISDSTILTASARDAAAQAYLTDMTIPERGVFTVETFNPSTNIRAGSRVTITDAQLGLSAAAYPIASIQKTFQGGNLETWTVAYGGLRPSFTNAVRRLTRSTRS